MKQSQWFRALPFPSYARLDLAYQDVNRFTNPAVSSNFFTTIPSDNIVILLALEFTLQTNATVATRQVILQLLDSTINTFLNSPAIASQAASLVQNYHMIGGVSAAYSTPGSADNVSPLPEFLLYPGWAYQIIVNNIQVGDKLTAIRQTVLKIPTGPQADTLGGFVAPIAIPQTLIGEAA